MADLFSVTYSDARARFLEACLAAGANAECHSHPLSGPIGERLACDVAWIGPRDAPEVAVVVSGTHGAEGYAGSAIQTGLLLEPGAAGRGAGQALLLVHALNPYGFAWMRRVNEDNIDLNRNFVRHAEGDYPENDLFEEIAPHVIPETWDEPALARNAAALERLAEEHGADTVRKSLKKGQYRHPDNVHYGGRAPAWSNLVLQEICARWLDRAERALMIDVHTGLGPHGYGELMTPAKPGEPVFERLHAVWGDEVHSTTAGPSAYAGSKGSILAGFRPGRAGLDFAAVGLEYGTRPTEVVRRAVDADTWLHAKGDLDSPLGRQIKRDLRDAFYPEEDAWKAAVWERGHEVVARAFAGLAAAGAGERQRADASATPDRETQG